MLDANRTNTAHDCYSLKRLPRPEGRPVKDLLKFGLIFFCVDIDIFLTSHQN